MEHRRTYLRLCFVRDLHDAGRYDNFILVPKLSGDTFKNAELFGLDADKLFRDSELRIHDIARKIKDSNRLNFGSFLKFGRCRRNKALVRDVCNSCRVGLRNRGACGVVYLQAQEQDPRRNN